MIHLSLSTGGAGAAGRKPGDRRGGAVLAASVVLSFALGCGNSTNTAPVSTGSAGPAPIAAGIHALTQVNAGAGTGYFSDPYPVHQATTAGSYVPDIAGTTPAVMSCTTLAQGCYSATGLTVTNGSSITAMLPQGATISSFENHNIYQTNAGTWHMAVTAYLNYPAANPAGNIWNVILHASPATGSPTTAQGTPLTWTTDAVLAGSLSTYAAANYDGKYFEDSGNLYLLYSMVVQNTSAGQQIGVVALPMTSPTQPAGASPTVLLAPENNSDGGYTSELRNCSGGTSTLKLIETGNIAVVGGKYAMSYSTGAYDTPCYKIGVAWSDSFLGPYKKVLQSDTNNVWGNPAAENEVVYLLQGLKTAWPNFVNSTVQGPGVPSLVQYPSGTWYLYFAGYDPSVQLSMGLFDPKLRQPYLMRLSVNVPSGTTVTATANTALVSWATAADQ